MVRAVIGILADNDYADVARGWNETRPIIDEMGWWIGCFRVLRRKEGFESGEIGFGKFGREQLVPIGGHCGSFQMQRV